MGPRYPHMYSNEAEIWTAWLALHAAEYYKFEYDVHVGRPWPEHVGLEPSWRAGADSVYLKRIDVVGFQPDAVTIFEVKPHAGLGAIGQVVGYMALYEDMFSPRADMKGAIVTELVDPNVSRILEEHGIALYVVKRSV